MKLPAESLRGIAGLVADLCRLRRGPDDMPYAPALLVAAVVAGVVLDVVIGSALRDAGGALSRSLISSAVVLGLCWAVLAMRELRSRFVQTALALAACSLVFSLLQVPLALLAGPAPASAAELSAAQILIGWITLALFGWQLAVDAHIMRRALDVSFGFGFALVAAWVIVYWALDRLVFGSAAT